MQVLTVANHLGSRGGLERTQMTTCRMLAARGHGVDVVYVSAGDFAEDWRSFAGDMVQMTGSLPRRRAPVASSVGLLRAIVAGARLSPEVIYVYRYWDLPYARAVSVLSGAPVVFHLCLPPPRKIPAWLRPALAGVTRTLSVSRDTANRWAGTGLRADRIEVVLTGVDLDRYRPAGTEQRRVTRRQVGVPPDAILVLYAGRIGREKGVDVLIEAFSLATAELPDAHLLVVGSASLGADPADSARYRVELEARAQGRPITLLPGRNDVVPLLQAADVAVVPSLWPEPLSRSVMEALACGVPVVATDVGGNPEILSGWLSAYLVAPGDPEALAKQLVDVGNWRSRHPGLGPRCREHAEQALTLDAEVDLVDRALHEAAATRRRSALRWRKRSRPEPRSWG